MLLDTTESFTAFCRDVEPRLRHAFAARYGHADGAEAVSEALAYAWEHWDRVSRMANPAGYLFRVGSSRTRRIRRRTPLLAQPPAEGIPDVEPRLPVALARLPDRQRVCVVLAVSFEWPMPEVAELLGVSVSTVRNHVDRGLRKLRMRLDGER